MVRYSHHLWHACMALLTIALLAACGPSARQASAPVSGLPATSAVPMATTLPAAPSTAIRPTPTAVRLAPTTAPPPAATLPTATAKRSVLPALPQPTPDPIGGPMPPPAWLVVGDTAVPATLGGFSYTVELGGGQLNNGTRDGGDPQDHPDLAPIRVPAGEAAALVIGTTDVEQALASIQLWSTASDTSPPRSRPLAERQRGDGVTVFSLALADAAQDQLLQVVATFAGGFHEGDYATYYWRIATR